MYVEKVIESSFILRIIRNHVRTFKANGKLSLYSQALLLWIPLVSALALLMFHYIIKDSLFTVYVISLSIFTSLIFSLHMMVYNYIRKVESTQGSEDRLRYLENTYTHISFLILVALSAIVILTTVYLKAGASTDIYIPLFTGSLFSLPPAVSGLTYGLSIFIDIVLTFAFYFLDVTFFITLFIVLKDLHMLEKFFPKLK